MEREIRFRAKREHDGIWVYGDLTHQQRITGGDPVSIPCIRVSNYNVDESTIGQFTGLYDAERRPIYEGDIVCHGLSKGLFRVVYAGDGFRVERGKNSGRLSASARYCTVVGNIYDDGKMLEDEPKVFAYDRSARRKANVKVESEERQ